MTRRQSIAFVLFVVMTIAVIVVAQNPPQRYGAGGLTRQLANGLYAQLGAANTFSVSPQTITAATPGYVVQDTGGTVQGIACNAANIFALSVNRNACTGTFLDATKTTASIFITGNALDSNIDFRTTAANNTAPTLAMTIDKNQNVILTGQLQTASLAGIKGTTTNDSANAGSIGEIISGTTAANTTALTTATSVNVGAGTNISLTAGDWDCTGVVNFTLGATTSVTNLSGGVSTTTGTLPAQDSFFDFETAGNVMTNTKVPTFIVPTVRISVSGTTNVFLVTQASFTASTAQAGGTIRCRRVR